MTDCLDRTDCGNLRLKLPVAAADTRQAAAARLSGACPEPRPACQEE